MPNTSDVKRGMNNVSDLFEKFGGIGGVAAAIGCNYSTASEMKRRKSVPVAHWPALIASPRGREIGLTSDELLRLHAAPFRGAGEIEAPQAPALVEVPKGQTIERVAR
jgi:hypothetical protein